MSCAAPALSLHHLIHRIAFSGFSSRCKVNMDADAVFLSSSGDRLVSAFTEFSVTTLLVYSLFSLIFSSVCLLFIILSDNRNARKEKSVSEKKRTKSIDTVSVRVYNAVIDTVSINPCPETGGKDDDQRNARAYSGKKRRDS